MPPITEQDFLEKYITTDFKPPSTSFSIRSKGNFISTFQTLMMTDLNYLQSDIGPPFYNLTKGKHRALKNLRDKEGIIIRSADKEGDIVIWDRIDYINKTKRILDDKIYYKTLEADPTKDFLKEFIVFIEDALQWGSS